MFQTYFSQIQTLIDSMIITVTHVFRFKPILVKFKLRLIDRLISMLQF